MSDLLHNAELLMTINNNLKHLDSKSIENKYTKSVSAFHPLKFERTMKVEVCVKYNFHR